MNKVLLTLVIILSAIGFATLLNFVIPIKSIETPLISEQPRPKPLLVYTFQNLKKTKFPESQITFGDVVDETPNSVSRMFYYNIPTRPGGSKMEKVSGLANIPKNPGNYPIIVMFRGYVPLDIYKPGIGTQPSAKVLAQNGFITLAPDFLGYGESASPSSLLFEDRFQTYTTALTLLSSLPTVNKGLTKVYSDKITANLDKIGIWGHSNGGHITLATLAISGVTYPTVLWAPVSKSFPYSILYYTDETDDQGKSLRLALANFEKDYNTQAFSPASYYKWIKAPIQVNQGENDEEVPVWWSNELVDNLKKDGLDVDYHTYPNADHNLLPDGWNSAINNTVDFYNTQFEKNTK
ncbi:MAG TPA: prolyl oligopeptidase family serine peptidase [Patescibacteria group bacterium]|nr:prolyl oligopeptidase family serine peptidase [Patescibacteria group bacterium]